MHARWGSLGLAMVCLMMIGCSRRQEPKQQPDTQKGSKSLVIVSYGGSYQEAQRKAYFEPFAKAAGVTVQEQSHEGNLGQIKAMVETGNVPWDVIDVESYMVIPGAKMGLYEPIDFTIVPKDSLMPEAIHTHGVAVCFWSTVLGYNTKSFDATHPKSWAEFWDIKAFPGPRALRRHPIGNIEFALLADGVAPQNLYPPDLARAFRSLDRIKASVHVWWEAGEQPAQLLSQGEVTLASAWNGRIFNAQKSGNPVAIEWNQGMLDSDWWVIPKGSRNKTLAMEFIRFASSAKRQAEFSMLIPYGPSNPSAEALIPAERAHDLPTSKENRSKQFLVNTAWWAEHQAEVLTQWNAWLAR